jgi:hypothetical protein
MALFHIAPRDVPLRLATGAYIAHSGLEKWHGSREQAVGLRGVAAGAFPVLRMIPSRRFLRLLAASELATGTLLLLWQFQGPGRLAFAAAGRQDEG